MNRLHRLVLHAYPAAFRRQFGDELQRVFEERVQQAAARSRLRGAALTVFFILDALASGLAERRRSRAARDVSVASRLDGLRRDVLFAMRQLQRAPMFAALTVVLLAGGIGATTAIFAVVRAALLEPLPYHAPDGLVMVWSDNTRNGEPNNPVSPANFEAFRAAPSLERVEALYSFLTPLQVRIGDEPEAVLASQVTPGMLSLLGRAPLIGRTFDDPGVPEGAILSHSLWRNRFGSDPSVIGRSLAVTGAGILPIVGVMPADFTFPYGPMLASTGFTRSLAVDLWLPMSRQRDWRLVDASGQPNRSIHYFAVLGRMRPGASLERVRADLTGIARRRAVDFPDTNEGWGVNVRPLHEQTVGPVRPALLLLLGGVGLVLLITCINVANVLLARAAGRGRDLAVRSALGATRGRLMQQALVESLLLACVGGALGVAIIAMLLPSLLALAPSHLPRLAEAGVSRGVILFALALSLVTGVLIGVLPALTVARANAEDSLRNGTRATASRARRTTRAALIVAEVALAMVLTVGGALLLRSFVSVLNVDPGFNPDRLLTMQIGVPARYSGPEAVMTFYDALEARLRALPGVEAVGGTTRLPLGSTNVTTFLEIDGRPLPRPSLPEVEMRRALFDYFGAMEIPLLRGRVFSPADRLGTPPVAVVNQALADRVFPGEDAIGRRVRFASTEGQPWITIVGIVGNIRHGSLEEVPRPELYVSYRQGPPSGPFLVVRTAGDPSAAAPAVRGVARELGADPPRDVATMAALRSGSLAARRYTVLLVSLLGVLALALATVGVFGVVTLTAAERTGEVGIRLALGASPWQLVWLVMSDAVGVAGIGVVCGGAVALALSPLLQSQLFHVGPTDPATYMVVAAGLLASAACGALLPARRALTVDPASALRR